MLFRAWDVIKCKNGHPVFLAISPMEDCKDILGIVDKVRAKLVDLPNLKPGYQWTCKCGEPVFSCTVETGIYRVYR